MNTAEIVIGLIFVATLLSAVAQRVGVAYPIVLVIGGLLISFLPGAVPIQLAPEVVFLVFIPPLVYLPASQVGLLDFRTRWYPIVMLSIGLVVITLAGVAILVKFTMPEFSWSTAFVLAAIVAPTDLIAVNAITRRSPVPTGVTRILDGESLFNDVVAFVAYKIAIGAVLKASFTVQHTIAEFAWDLIAGAAAGWVVAAIAIWIRKREHDPAINGAISLLTSFAAYLAGEAVGASGILATVTAGLFVGQKLSRILEPAVRQGSFSFWTGLNFILEGLAFVLIGLEMRPILNSLSLYSTGKLLTDAAVISGAVILLRLTWVALVFFGRMVTQRFFQLPRFQADWRQALIVGWSGTRGLDSLAAALGVPLLLPDAKTLFPQRDLILFHSFCVILVTLLFQGLTLPWLIRWLSVPIDHSELEEEKIAKLAAAQAAIRALNHLSPQTPETAELIVHLQKMYERRIQRFSSDSYKDVTEPALHQIMTPDTLRLKILHAQREAIIGLRDQGVIGSAVLRRMERSLDYEEIHLTT